MTASSTLASLPGKSGTSGPLRPLLAAISLAVLAAAFFFTRSSSPFAEYLAHAPSSPSHPPSLVVHDAPACRQVDPLVPPAHEAHDAQLKHILSSPDFALSAATILSGAVQIKTESYDDGGPVDQDPRWDIFSHFAAYIKRSFPVIHKHLNLKKVNTHGLLYTWQGTDKSLKPLLLLAHQVS
jgi:hypothetical protein